EIIPGRPPTKEITTAIINDAYSPTIWSTPAIIEKAIASGINASATTIPERISHLTLETHSLLILFTTIFILLFLIYCYRLVINRLSEYDIKILTSFSPKWYHLGNNSTKNIP